jgi:hypothetical protein
MPKPKIPRTPVRYVEHDVTPTPMTTYWYYRATNDSPKVTAAFLAAQRKLLLPQQFAREHENQWVDGADALTTASDVDAAMDTGWTMRLRGDPAIGGYVCGPGRGARPQRDRHRPPR